MKIQSILTTLTAILIATVVSFAAESNTNNKVFRKESMKTIAKLSKTQRKPVMIYVGADNCVHSRRMNDVLNTKMVSNFLGEKYICKNLDAGKLSHQFKATELGVTSIPSYVFLNSSGKVVKIVTGYKKADKMVEEAATALAEMKDSNNRQE